MSVFLHSPSPSLTPANAPVTTHRAGADGRGSGARLAGGGVWGVCAGGVGARPVAREQFLFFAIEKVREESTAAPRLAESTKKKNRTLTPEFTPALAPTESAPPRGRRTRPARAALSQQVRLRRVQAGGGTGSKAARLAHAAPHACGASWPGGRTRARGCGQPMRLSQGGPSALRPATAGSAHPLARTHVGSVSGLVPDARGCAGAGRPGRHGSVAGRAAQRCNRPRPGARAEHLCCHAL